MDLPDAVKEFESILKCHAEKTLDLYEQQDRNLKCNVKPKEVISNLRHQLNSLQKADVMNNVQHNTTKSFKNKTKCLQFVSVNKLSDGEVSFNQLSTSKFETQFVSDTQLISLIEGAEVQLEQGMTQEFANSFIKIDNEDEIDGKLKSDDDLEEKREKSVLTCEASTVLLNDSEVNSCNKYIEENMDASVDSYDSTTKEFNVPYDVEMPLSPVLQFSKINSVKSNIVCDLESFEKFESIAVPIVEEHPDKKTATKIINSQIVDRVLFLNLHAQPILIERDKQSSPVINLTDENLVINKDYCEKITPDKKSDTLADEILFSSDEEDDFINDLTPELPMSPDTSSDEAEDCDKLMYVGFQTASNKTIQICADSFQTAKSVLEDIDKVKRNNNNSLELMGNGNICKEEEGTERKRTGVSLEENSNKKIKLSEDIKYLENINEKYNGCHTITQIEEDNLSKIIDEDLIQEFDNVEMSQNHIKYKTKEENTKNDDVKLRNTERDKVNNTFNSDVQCLTASSILRFCGFKTASNKEVNISNSAIAKSRAIFEDFDLSKDQITSNNTAEESKFSAEINMPFVGFQTASNKEVKISTEALEKSRTLFENIDILSSNQSEFKEIPEFKGFKTASNKEIKISQEALKKYENILNDINDFGDGKDEVTNQKETMYKSAEPSKTSFTKDISSNNANHKSVFEGFRTASNKVVKVSETSLQKSKKIFKDLNSTAIDEGNLLDQLKQNANCSKSVGKDTSCKDFAGFRTASNKEVIVSKAALDKSKLLLKDFDTQNEAECFEGFETASNKKVTVSENALLKTKEIFQDVDFSHKSFDLDTQFRGFQTASNKNVLVSKEALEESKKMFPDFNNDLISKETTDKSNILLRDHDFVSEPQKLLNFQGFQTASNKTVTVSEKALQNTKKIFQDINFGQNSIEPKLELKGFQTASNKSVLVSKKALEKSKKIIDDLNDKDIEFKPNKIPGYDDFKKLSEMTNISHKFYTKTSEDRISSKNKDSFNIGIKSGNTRSARILKEALNKSQEVPEDNETAFRTESIILDDRNDINRILNTQVIDNFDETLHTEDFIPRSKRSGSPILCSSKKRKKFETPYRSSPNVKPSIQQAAKINPVINLNLNYKKTKEYNLKDVLELENKSTGSNQNTDFKTYDFDDLLQFEFEGERNELKNTKLTTNDLITIFEDSIDKKIIPKGWLQNHLKLILWKLISYEVKFPKVMYKICTAKNVLEQLRFRYKKELYDTCRPALRKILEKDDTSVKTMILSVVAVYVNNVKCVKINSVETASQNIELLLTDGWYTVMASLDKMLIELVTKGKIVVGMKLAVCGAELLNCEQGMSPWENTSAVRLKLFGNSTKRARWDARLGFHGNGAILSQLSAVKPDGGKVTKMRAFVTRVYPMLYVEKFEDGSTVTRSERLETLHQIKYENERQALMEKIYEEVEKEFADEGSQDSQPASDDKLETGSQIARAMKSCNDPVDFRNHLTSTQLRHLHQHTNRRREEYLQKVQERLAVKIGEAVNRRVASVVKMRVAGLVENQGVACRNAMLTIWRPSETVLEIIKEGTWIDITNAVPTSVRYQELQISAGRQSIFCESKHKPTENIINYTKTLKRQCFKISDLTAKSNINFDEIDTLGMVFLIEPPIKSFDSTKQPFQNVYLTDADKKIICVNFWGGIKKFGFENILNVGHVLVCVNLRKRAGNTRKSIPQFRVTEFTYFTKTPKDRVAKGMLESLSKTFLRVDVCTFSLDCEILKNNIINKTYNTDNISPYRFNSSDYNISKNKIFIDSPLTTKTSKNDDNLNLTGLDFESTFRQTNTQDLSPKTLIRKRKVQERIDKLKRYGDPPPISPIAIINQSKNAAKAFKSPLPNSNCASAASEQIPTDSSDRPPSPIIAINKKKINPVKLNFSNSVANNESVLDQFGEEFEGSPPLSLD